MSYKILKKYIKKLLSYSLLDFGSMNISINVKMKNFYVKIKILYIKLYNNINFKSIFWWVYGIFYGSFCFYCAYHWCFIPFFENFVYSIESVDDVKPALSAKKKKVKLMAEVLLKQPIKVNFKNLPKIQYFHFPGASYTFDYYLVLINNAFQFLTSVKVIPPELSVVNPIKKEIYEMYNVKSEMYNVKSETPADVLEQLNAPVKRWKDRRASGDRVAKAMEAAIRHWILNYKEFCVPFTNILDYSNIFAFDKWLYWEYYALVHIDNNLKPKSEQDFSDFVLICQFMERYNFKYNLTREELDFLLMFKKHYHVHNVEWNFVEWLLCLESYKNHLELMERTGILETFNLKKKKNIALIKDLITLENLRYSGDIDNIINVENKEGISVIQVKKRIPLLLMFDLDLRLAYAKHSDTMLDSYYGSVKVFKYSDDKFNVFLRVKKRFHDRVLIANIVQGFDLIEYFKPYLTPSTVGHCWMFGLDNYDWPLNDYIVVPLDKRFHEIPISLLTQHFKYDPAFYRSYKNIVKDKNIIYLNMWLMDILHTFFYANWSCKDYLKALYLQQDYPNSLILLNCIKNAGPDLAFYEIIEVYQLYCKYNKVWYMDWWHYITGRQYSMEQLIKLYKLLQTEEWKDKESKLLSYLQKNDKLFRSYYNVNDMTFHKKPQRRWWK